MTRENPNRRSGITRELGLLVSTVREATHDHAKDLAAAIAFWAFFSIFPLLIGILSLAGHFLRSAELQARIFDIVIEMFPGSAVLVQDKLDSIVQYRGTMSLVSIGGLLWTASKGFGAITRAVNQALGAKRTHHFLLSKIRHFSMAVAVSALAITSIGITVALEIIVKTPLLVRLGFDELEISRLNSWSLSFLLIFLTFALIYKLAPYVETRWRQVVLGALLAALLFELVKAAFVFYLDRVSHFEAFYGSLSSIIVMLLWLYLSALILVLGAEYNIVRAKAGVEGTKVIPGDAA